MSKKAYIFKGRSTKGSNNSLSRMLSSKIASSYWFVYTLAFAFVLAILYIVFSQTLNVYIYPTTQFLTGGNTTAPDKWLGFWGLVPYMIIFIIGLFMYFRLTQSSTGE